MLSQKIVSSILTKAISKGADFAEVYCDDNSTTSMQMNGGSLEYGSLGRDYGAGIRLFRGLQNIYACSNDLSEGNLLQLTEKAADTLRFNGIQNGMRNKAKADGWSETFRPPAGAEYGRKAGMLREITAIGEACDSRIKKVTVNYYDGVQHVQIANTDGLYAEDTRVKTRIRIGALADDGKARYMGFIGPGAMRGFDYYDSLDIQWYTEEACRIAIAMLDARYAPAGRMSVIVDNGFGGLLFHEACGHSLEASSVAKGASEFSGRLGEQVASPLLTLIDDGSMPGKWGSSGVDDEGEKTRENKLIENGKLKGYMIDKLNGRRMNMAPTGSARRQSYRFAPTSRMTNTYIAPGKSSREEILSDTEKGIFVRYINAGSVNPVTGEFNFSTMESYMVENGKITYPVKGASLIGTGREILQKIDRVGDNLEIGEGFCFAGSGTLFICAGQPTVRISDMTIGGADIG